MSRRTRPPGENAPAGSLACGVPRTIHVQLSDELHTKSL